LKVKAHECIGVLENRDSGVEEASFLDVAITEIAIKKIPKRKEERSTTTVFGFRGFKRPTLNLQTRESTKSDLISAKRGSHEDLLWVQNFQWENRRVVLEFFGPAKGERSCVDVNLPTCGL